LDHNIGFQEKRQFFPRKMAENCDHNIDPCFLNNLKHFFSFFLLRRHRLQDEH
jgi:hypothetical protein